MSQREPAGFRDRLRRELPESEEPPPTPEEWREWIAADLADLDEEDLVAVHGLVSTLAAPTLEGLNQAAGDLLDLLLVHAEALRRDGGEDR